MDDLIVLGATAQGISVASRATAIGVPKVRILEPSTTVAFADTVGPNRLDISYDEKVVSIDVSTDGLTVRTKTSSYETRTCVVALNNRNAPVVLPSGILASQRVHEGPFEGNVDDLDILVVGNNDRAVVLTSQCVHAGARSVVLAAQGMNPDLLADASHDEIAKLEKDRKLTVLYRSAPARIDYVDGCPIVDFADNRTPELIFDHVIFAPQQLLITPEELGISEAALATGLVMYVRDPRIESELPSGTYSDVIAELAPRFSSYSADALEKETHRKKNYRSAPEELREEFYNATITHFEKTHSDLWVVRVKPDKGDISHSPGQYASLGLGFWEDRIDDADDSGIEAKWDKLVRRSYSISNRIFTKDGYLASEVEDGELEFYVVLVPPTPGNTPGLTPRLALKKAGDRIYLGPKVTGRYTTKSVVNPMDTVLFFSTGTGEAPHNSMIVQLLRNGHHGKIISAVTVRHSKDLGYLQENRHLEERYPNYIYIPMPTREPDVPKRYLQDLIVDGDLEKILGAPLDPSTTHAFLCGNPAMIGIPEEDEDGNDIFPEPIGVVQLLAERGFTVDKRKTPGNIHFEKYW